MGTIILPKFCFQIGYLPLTIKKRQNFIKIYAYVTKFPKPFGKLKKKILNKKELNSRSKYRKMKIIVQKSCFGFFTMTIKKLLFKFYEILHVFICDEVIRVSKKKHEPI